MQSVSQKFAAIIYLRTSGPLRLDEFAAKFREQWPDLKLVDEGSSVGITHFGIGDSHFSLAFSRSMVPNDITASALPSRQWPNAEEDLARHTAYLKVVVPAEPAVATKAASDLTKVVVSVLAVTDGIGVCWLNTAPANASVLNPSRAFTGIASQMMRAGAPPLVLWVAAIWKRDDHLLHTGGMSRFGVPEIFLALKEPSRKMLEFLFDVAYYAFSGNEMRNGETMDGPEGLLRIQTLNASDGSRRGVILSPASLN